MLRVGIAGLGFMGQTHVASLVKTPGAEVVALADVDPERRAGRFGEKIGNLETTEDEIQLGDIRSYESPDGMLADDGVDAVCLCLPTDKHASASIAALEAGKHTFCEKPMALNVADGQRMIDASEKANRALQIGHCLRFWPEYVAADEIIRSGKYGRALAASFTRCGGQPNWAADGWFAAIERSGGALFDLHVHDADVAVWWWGRPAEIIAGGARVNGAPNLIHSRWVYEDGLSVQIESTWEPVPTAPFFYGLKVSLEHATLLYDSRNDAGLQLATEEGVEKIEVDTVTGHVREIEYFVDCVSNGKPITACAPASNLIAVECVCEEARQLGLLLRT